MSDRISPQHVFLALSQPTQLLSNIQFVTIRLRQLKFYGWVQKILELFCLSRRTSKLIWLNIDLINIFINNSVFAEKCINMNNNDLLIGEYLCFLCLQMLSKNKWNLSKVIRIDIKNPFAVSDFFSFEARHAAKQRCRRWSHLKLAQCAMPNAHGCITLKS